MEQKIENTLSLLKDIYDKKFKTVDGLRRFHNADLIKKDIRYNDCKDVLNYFYYDCGYGIKYLIKYLKIEIGCSVLRFCLINFFDIKLRDNKEITDNLRKLRQEKAKRENINKTGFASIECIEKTKNRNTTSRGIQGYYFNESIKRYVWLRSSWEYIYAKWLNEKKILWDIECNIFKLDNNLIYRPDFFIFDENNKIKSIVEIKGYWKDKVWKYDELKGKLKNINFSLITDIKPYTNQYYKDIKIWKKERILKIKN